MMRAAQFSSFGAPSVLKIVSVPTPRPAPDEVLIRVAASSINGTDLFLRQAKGAMRLIAKLPFTPGFDVAGRVEACGAHVTAFAPGDPVYALLGHRGGGAAEFALCQQFRAAIAPKNIPLEVAAGVPLSGLTALQALRGLGGVRAGQRVLIYGASGGIGAFAVQLATHFGAHVTGIARQEKLEFVSSLGAAEVFDRGTPLEDLRRDWDVVLDAAPALSFETVEPLLAPQGVFVSVRAIPSGVAELRGLARRRGRRWRGVQTAERGLDLAYLARLIDDGLLHVPVDRTFTLIEIADAHTYAESSAVKGKVIVTT
jgi:NADPH:quinone reductase